MRFAFIVTLHVFAVGLLSHPTQVTDVEVGGLGDAVSVTAVPVGKIKPQVTEQPIPAGELTTVPVPVILTTRVGPVGPVPVKHTTVAVMKAV